MSIDPKGLRGFRPDYRRRNDPDETEGRAMYRAAAEAQARKDMAMTRRVRYSPHPPPERE